MKKLNITQNSGYVLSPLNVDGQAVSAESNYTFTNVVSNHTISATFVVDNSAPGVPSVSVSSKTTSSFTVSAVATDVDGDNLVYKLYVKQASESAYSLKATSASTASATAVSLTASGLSEYTDYNYYVTVTDGSETSTSNTGNVKTYCGGPSTNQCTASSSNVRCPYNYEADGYTMNTSYMSSTCRSFTWNAYDTNSSASSDTCYECGAKDYYLSKWRISTSCGCIASYVDICGDCEFDTTRTTNHKCTY